MVKVPEALVSALRNARNIALVAHARPDGDALGSTLALGLALENLGKTVTFWNEDQVPGTLSFLPGSQRIQQPSGTSQIPADLAVILDTTKERIGPNMLRALAETAQFVNIDHHLSNTAKGDLVWVNPRAAAAGEMVYELIDAAGWEITADARDNLFVAISSDTGGLRYTNTSAHTIRIMAALVDAGANPGELSRQIFGNYPLRRVILLRELLPLMRMSANDQIASCTVDLETKERLGIQASDMEGLIDILRGIDTVIAAVIFEENSNGEIRVSARSKQADCDVRRVCESFGGGGHQLAAGARMQGPLAQAEKQFTQALQDEITRPKH